MKLFRFSSRFLWIILISRVWPVRLLSSKCSKWHATVCNPEKVHAIYELLVWGRFHSFTPLFVRFTWSIREAFCTSADLSWRNARHIFRKCNKLKFRPWKCTIKITIMNTAKWKRKFYQDNYKRPTKGIQKRWNVILIVLSFLSCLVFLFDVVNSLNAERQIQVWSHGIFLW